MKYIIENGILTKRGKQVHKFWKYKGYAVSVESLKDVTGVRLYTQYDGTLYADKKLFLEHGIKHKFGKEDQLILEEKYWTVESLQENAKEEETKTTQQQMFNVIDTRR